MRSLSRFLSGSPIIRTKSASEKKGFFYTTICTLRLYAKLISLKNKKTKKINLHKTKKPSQILH